MIVKFDKKYREKILMNKVIPLTLSPTYYVSEICEKIDFYIFHKIRYAARINIWNNIFNNIDVNLWGDLKTNIRDRYLKRN